MISGFVNFVLKLLFLAAVFYLSSSRDFLAHGAQTPQLSSEFTVASVDAVEIQEQQTEYIIESPLILFSERSQLWPSTEIELSGPAGFQPTDSLNSTPGVQARQSGSPLISIRGSASADRVLSLFEGTPVNLGDGLGASELFLPSEIIDKINLFKGPASVFFGSSAMGGALDHRASRFNSPVAGFGLTNFDGYHGENSVFAATPFNSKSDRSKDEPPASALSGQVSGFYRRNSGAYPYRGTTSTASGVRINNATDLSRVASVSEFKSNGFEFRPILLFARIVGEAPTSLAFTSASTFDNSGLLAGIELKRTILNSGRLSSRIYHVRQWGLFDRGTTIETNSFAYRTGLSFDFQTQLNHKLLARTFIDQQWDALAASYLGSGTLNQSDFAMGFSLNYALLSNLSIESIVRYRAESGDFFKAFGLVSSEDHTKTWITFSEGFRAPSLSDRFANTSYFKGNIGLLPEKSRGGEIGWQKFNDSDTRIGFTAFVVRYDDLFDSAKATGSATTKINSGRATASGCEFFAEQGFSRDKLKGQYSYLDAKNEDRSEPLRLSPQHQWSLTAQHYFSFVVAEIKHTLWSSFYDRDTSSGGLRELPGWTTWDLTFRNRSRNNWETQAGVINFFNTARELTIGYPEPQRRFFISALHFF